MALTNCHSAAPSDAVGVRRMIEDLLSVLFPAGFVMQCFLLAAGIQVELEFDIERPEVAS